MSRLRQIAAVFCCLLLLQAIATYSEADEILKRILDFPPTQIQAGGPIDGFAVFGGEWQLEDDGVVSITARDGPKLVCTLPEFQELVRGEVSVEMFIPETQRQHSNAGIILKIRDAGVGADAFLGYEISPSPENQHVNIALHRNDYRPLQRPAFEIPTDRWITLNVLFEETAFEVRVDGKTVTRYEGSSPDAVRSGGIALRPWQRFVKYRNLKIKNTTNETSPGDWVSIPFREPQADTGTCWPPSLAVETLPPILFLTRHPLTRPAAVGQDLWLARPSQPGCSIRIMEPAHPERAIKTIFHDPDGSIYDMNLSLDGKTVYFSHKKSGEEYWHLWRIGTDGSGLRRLTNGPYYDVSPCETPEGDLIFVSTRRFGYTVCQPGPASNLHRLRNFGEGETPEISCVSMNTLSDMSPQMLPDGRVLFTRWEYIDRDLTYRQSLWTQNPDGTGYQLFFGNTIRDVGTFWQARPLPGYRDRLVATFAPHHNYPHGMIGLIDRKHGIEGPKGEAYIYITKEVPVVADNNMPWAYRDPFPLSEDTFLCSFGDGPGYYKDGKKRFGIYLLNQEGEGRLLYEDAEQSCFFPIPLQPSPPIPIILDRSQPTPTDRLTNPDDDSLTGTLILTNVNEGLQGKVEPGTIVALRVMEQVRKTEELVNRAYDQSPVMSYGTYYAKRDWGTVPLEADGSAHFVVPALREVYLQALDAEGREVQRMTSALQVMPGEQLSCTGCHEDRDAAPVMPNRMPLAARQTPYMPKSPDWLLQRERPNPLPDARVFDYPSVVQPVLDKYCISCHNGDQAEGGYDLTGDKTRFFSMSYDNLLGTSQSYRQHNMLTGEMLPEEAAKGKPLVHFFWLLQTPSAVNQPYWTGSHASRLTELIESDHAGVAIPLEDRQKIYYWIDANVPYYSTYAHARPKAPGRRDRFADPESGRFSPWFSERFVEVYDRRCTECHGPFMQPRHLWTGRYAWINLDHPNRSAALTAHLSKDSGGRGIATVKNAERSPAASQEELLFSDKNDSDYLKMFNAIEEGRRIMLAHPEADMPGFSGAKPEP